MVSWNVIIVRRDAIAAGRSAKGDSTFAELLAAAEPARCKQQQENDAERRQVAEAYEGRIARVSLYLTVKDVGRVVRELAHHVAARADDRGCTSIGRAQHRAAGLQGAQTRNLQVLRQRFRIVEPREIGEIQQQGRRALRIVPGLDDLVAEQIFVADVDRDALARKVKRRLPAHTAFLIADRHLHQVDEPAKAEGNEFTKRHKMALAVALRAGTVRRKTNRAVVEVAFGFFDEDAEYQRRLAVAHELDQIARDRVRQITQRQRINRFRKRNEVDVAGSRHQAEVGLMRKLQALRPELLILRDVALDQPNRKRFAERLRPGNRRKLHATEQQRPDQHRAGARSTR